MAADVVDLAEHFGHHRFAVIGHDRGALVAIRAGLDHPDRVTHLGSLDVLPEPSRVPAGQRRRGRLDRRRLPRLRRDRPRARPRGPRRRPAAEDAVTVLQQDWGSDLGFDAETIWRRWATDLDHRTQPLGHFMAEESPDAVLDALTELLSR